MTYFKELGARLEEAAQAGGKFADALVRAAGSALSGMLTFVDREMEYAAKAAKKGRKKPSDSTNGGSRKTARRKG